MPSECMIISTCDRGLVDGKLLLLSLLSFGKCSPRYAIIPHEIRWKKTSVTVRISPGVSEGPYASATAPLFPSLQYCRLYQSLDFHRCIDARARRLTNTIIPGMYEKRTHSWCCGKAGTIEPLCCNRSTSLGRVAAPFVVVFQQV